MPATESTNPKVVRILLANVTVGSAAYSCTSHPLANNRLVSDLAIRRTNSTWVTHLPGMIKDSEAFEVILDPSSASNADGSEFIDLVGTTTTFNVTADILAADSDTPTTVTVSIPVYVQKAAETDVIGEDDASKVRTWTLTLQPTNIQQ